MSQTVEHIGSTNGEKLTALISKLALMGGQVEVILSETLSAVQSRDPLKASDTPRRAGELTDMRRHIDQNAENLLTIHHYYASELRRLIGTIKVATDIERIGQLSANISNCLKKPYNIDALTSVSGINQLGRQVQHMVTSAMDALVHENPSKAMQVYHAYDDITRLHDTIENNISNLMIDGKLASGAGTDLLFIIRHFQRMADHACNIAKTVYYSHTAAHLEDNIHIPAEDKQTISTYA